MFLENNMDNMNKLVILFVVGIVILIAINYYKKSMGVQYATILSIIVIIVCGYFGYMLINDQEVQSNNNVLSENSINNVFDNSLVQEANAMNAINEANVEEVQEEVQEDFAGSIYDSESPTVREPFQDGVNEEAEANKPADTGKGSLNCKDLLPVNVDSTWAQVNPSGVGDLCTKNLLNAGHHIGVDTQGCSMRNSNRGLRSEPPNPQVQISPWLQTTICPDLLRKPLDCPSN